MPQCGLVDREREHAVEERPQLRLVAHGSAQEDGSSRALVDELTHSPRLGTPLVRRKEFRCAMSLRKQRSNGPGHRVPPLRDLVLVGIEGCETSPSQFG